MRNLRAVLLCASLGCASPASAQTAHESLLAAPKWTPWLELGGFYGSPNLQGTRSGLPMAAAWAVMQHLGVEGYIDLTRRTLATADRMRSEVAAIDGLRVLGDPTFHVFAIAADPRSTRQIDVFALGEAMARRGWYHDRQSPPDSLHSTVSAGNEKAIEEWVADIHGAVAEVAGTSTDDRGTSYSTVD